MSKSAGDAANRCVRTAMTVQSVANMPTVLQVAKTAGPGGESRRGRLRKGYSRQNDGAPVRLRGSSAPSLPLSGPITIMRILSVEPDGSEGTA